MSGAKSILLEFEVDEVAEPKGLLAKELWAMVQCQGSCVAAARQIGASKAFVQQNAKRNK